VFFKDEEGTALDLGGIAKGYGVDLLSQRLSDIGYKDHLVEWGGEVRASGCHPSGRPWRVGVRGLQEEGSPPLLQTLSLTTQAVATSGDDKQCWTAVDPTSGEKVSFSHIIDPKTLKPLQTTPTSIALCYVVADSCALADGLATAGMLFSTAQEGKLWFERCQEKYRDKKTLPWQCTFVVRAPS
jgi:thiamine biosynthesis lipoprotein